MSTTVIGGRFADKVSLAGNQFQIERDATFHGRVAQGSLAEAVDGVDRGQIEYFQRALEEVGCPLFFLVGQPVEIVPQRFIAALAGGQQRQGLHQPFADAVAQFGRGRLGERDDQNVAGIHFFILLQQQAQIDPGQGIGFAGAGAGLQAIDRLGQGVLNQIKFLHTTGSFC